MAPRKKGAAGKKAPAPKLTSVTVPAKIAGARAKTQAHMDADAIRSRIAGFTSPLSVPDPKRIEKVDVVSSGLISLDYALGIGGFARGRFHSVEGPSGSGKTALCIAAVAEMQRIDPAGVHALLDVEGTGDIDFFAKLGLDTDPSRFIILRPESAEEACLMAMLLMGYEEKDKKWQRNAKITPITSLIYDSWAGSPVDTIGMAPLARVGAEWIPNIATKAARGDIQTTIFWINQIRLKPGVVYGDPRYSPGGEALKFAQSTRLWVSATNIVKEDKLRIAHDLRVDVQKNKLAPPFHQVHLHLNYSTGFDRIVDAFTFFEKVGVSLKESENGTTYIFKYTEEDGTQDQVRAVGREAFLDEIRGNPYAGEAFINQAKALSQKGFSH